jgi:S1-C subfamily serine protease
MPAPSRRCRSQQQQQRRRLDAVSRHVVAGAGDADYEAQLQAALEAQQQAQLQMQAVVKIFVRSVDTSYTSPWQKMEAATGTGSGFSIGNNLILTNAHVVYNGVSVRVQRPGLAGQFEGKVVCIARQCDLALVKVDDSRFWQDLPQVHFSDELPELDTDVTAVGYPMGGDNLSITRGVVSRVDLMEFTMLGIGDPPLLSIQIDAAINPGNSGGAVFNESLQVCGVAFAGMDSGQSIGYVIPVSVVRLFLASFEEHGEFLGVPSLGVVMQTTENAAIKHKYGISAGDAADGASDSSGTGGGMIVTKVVELSSSEGVLQEGDVITTIGGQEVGEDGSVAFRGFERISLVHEVTSCRPGDELPLTVLREGELTELSIVLKTSPKLVPRLDGVDAQPKYLVVGGLVFVPLSVPFLMHHFGWPKYSPPAELNNRLRDPLTKDGNEVVILAKVLADDLNFGYQDMGGVQLTKLNGVEVESMAHLKQLLDDASAAAAAADEAAAGPSYFEIELENSQLLVLDVKACAELEGSILESYGLTEPRSRDLL